MNGPGTTTDRLLLRQWKPSDRTPFAAMNTANERSVAVMERIGMTHDPGDDFDHPRFPKWHRLRRHVLHRIRRDDEG